MTSSKNNKSDSRRQSFPGLVLWRFALTLFAAWFAIQAISPAALGQYYQSATPSAASSATTYSNNSGYPSYSVTTQEPNGWSQPTTPVAAAPGLTPLSQPQMMSPTQPANPSYGGMPVSADAASPYQNAAQPNTMQPGTMQPVPVVAPLNMQAPQGGMVPLNAQPVQGDNQPIRREQVGLADSNSVFDGETDRLMNGMQNTDPSLAMQTFRTGSSDIIPSGVENLRPVESGRGMSQMQSQVAGSPSRPDGNTPMFGAGSEPSLTELKDDSFDFSAIMQAQQQTGTQPAVSGGLGPNGAPAGYGNVQDASGGKIVNSFDKQAVDEEVENLKVIDVQIEGNGKVPQHSIRNMIKTMKDYPFHLQTVQEDARTLNQTGNFFSVTPRYQRKGDGVIVRFELVERPVFHSVLFFGNNKIHKRKLTEECGIKKGDPVDVQAVMQAREKLKEYYRSEGFERANVVIGSGDRLDDRNVVFIINEGGKQRILKTVVEGATFVSNWRLQTYIESKPGILYYIGGEFSREKLDADVEKLLDFYQRHGFFNIQIDRVFEEGTGYTGLGEPGSWIKVKFIVSEGPRYKINSIKFLGNRMFSDEEFTKDFHLKPGDPYLQTALKLDEASVGRKYGNKGHLLARAKANVRLISEKPGMVDITYSINESQPVVLTGVDVDVAGDESHTKTTTLLKHMALAGLKPGNLAKADDIRRAETSVSRPGFVNANPGEGQTPKIMIKPENGEEEPEGDEFLDMELQEIDDLTIRGQSPDGFTSSGLDPRDWRRIQQRNGVGVHPAFPDPEPLEYRVCYPQEGGTSDASLFGSSPYGSSSTTTQGGQYGVQQGSYAVPQQYQGTTSPNTPSTGTPYASTVQAGSVPSLPVNTNVSSSTPALGFFGQNEPEPYNANNAGAMYGDSMIAPSSPYGTGNYYGTTVPADGTGATATLDNTIIPATTNPYSYYGDNGYGSIQPASGTFPSAEAYNDFGAPGSIMRQGDDPFLNYARAKAILRVQEGKTGNLTMSVGINSDSGLVGRFALEERNFDWRKLPTNPWTIAGWRNAFRGAGQRFLLEAMPGEKYQRYSVSFQEPLLGSTRFSLGLNGFYYTRYYDEWRERRLGGGVTLGRAWTDRFSTSLSFNGANIRVYDPIAPIPDLMKVLGDNSQYAFGLSGTYDSRDNSIMPTEGGTLTVNAEQVLGTARFMRGGYDARRYYALHRRGDGSGAWVLGLRSAASVTEGTTPIFERYYAGGFSTIRGFEYRGVTPRWYGYGVGGNFEFYNSVELCFPISADDNFRGVVFVDTGTVESSISKWDSDYRVAPGFGIRLNIPMMGPVPIAFDFAFPINKNTGDVSQMFSFNMGLVR